ncbi:VanZ family protein [Chitinibacter bivalviorum]|uniref:VanZ family protein n=1 Tax=Chitinibacter bivalviorum TaxID=2739434 RepID=A0A7H9BMF3_9NEIS|nr:VanZ family protein [Chitinibacter bivalviorum]QLG89622.1 VanZ family protein [Chitinibacter bivalviorum]
MYRLPPIRYLARQAEPTRISPFFVAVSLLVILILSLFPFSDWRFTGEPVFAFFSYPLPYYATIFDNTVNVLAYIPLGLGLMLMFKHRFFGALLALVCCVLISSSVEFTQQFLPGRVASNLDILSNSFGGMIGICGGLILRSRRWMRHWLIFRHEVIAPGRAAEWATVWLMLWFFSQLDPTQPFLGVVVEARGLPQPFIAPINDAALFLRTLEGVGMMLNLAGVGLFVSVLVAYGRDIPRVMFAVLGLALVLKMAFAGMLLKPEQFFVWLNLNIALGGLIGVLILLLAWQLQRALRALLGVLCLSLATVVSMVWPLTPQLSGTMPLFKWQYGHLLHFNGLAQVIGDIWPFGAIAFLLFFLLRPISGQDFP